MMLLTFNRKLAWLVGALMLWSLCGLMFVLGLLPEQQRMQHGLPFELGLKRRDIHIPGRALELGEEQGQLLIHMAAPAGHSEERPLPPPELLEDLPADIELTYDPVQANGQRRPRIGPGLSDPQRLPGGGQMLLSTNYLLRLDRRGVTVMPRPRNMKQPWGERLLRRRIQRGMGEDPQGPAGRPGERRPPHEGQPGEPPPPPPGKDQSSEHGDKPPQAGR